MQPGLFNTSVKKSGFSLDFGSKLNIKGVKQNMDDLTVRMSAQPSLPQTNGYDSTEDPEKSKDLRDTLRYFKLMFNYSIDCVDGITDPAPLKCTPFHTALAQGDFEFVDKVFTSFHDNNLCVFAANSLVSYEDKPSVYDMLDNSSTLSGIERKSSMLHQNKSQEEGRGWTYPKQYLLFESPLSLAASSGNFDVVEVLLHHNADIFQQDTKGNTIIHSLVLLSKDRPQMAVEIFQKLSNKMGVLTNVAEKHRLAFMENNDGQTALDLAAKFCLPEIILAVLQWDSVYRFVLFEHGPFQDVYYDVTRYEQPHSKQHLLKEIAFATERDIKRLSNCKFLQQEPIKTWTEAILETHKIQRRAWTFYWVLSIIIFFFSCNTFLHNEDTYHPHPSLNIILLIVGLLEICSQVELGIHDKAAFGLTGVVFILQNRGGQPLAFTPLYRTFQFDFAILIIPIQIFHLLKFPYEDYRLAYVILYTFATCFAWLSLTVFIQLSSSMGHLLIIMDQMVKTATGLYMTSLTVLCIFPISLHLLKIHSDCPIPQINDTESSNSSLQATQSVNTNLSFWRTLYHTTVYGFGYLAPSQLYFDDSYNPLFSLSMYIVLLIVMNLVAMNLAIAVMSDRVTELNTHKSTLQGIQKLSMSLSMICETKLTSKLFGRFDISSKVWNRYRRGYFFENATQTQVFLRVVEKMPNLRWAA